MSLIKQFIHPKPKMQFQVTDIEFDFSDAIMDHDLTHCYQLVDETIGSFWEADDGDDLVEEITAATGWCIKSIDYRTILK